MKFTKQRFLSILLSLLMLFSLASCSMQDVADIIDIVGELAEAGLDSDIEGVIGGADGPTTVIVGRPSDTEAVVDTEAPIDKDGYYYSKKDVALYIHTYGHLPSNFITKDEAEELGWEGGSVEKYMKGGAIGGDRFGNRENLLPKRSGRVYYECDIDTKGAKSRGAKRIVFSNDGLIYYTDDHYESFTLLYGEE